MPEDAAKLNRWHKARYRRRCRRTLCTIESFYDHDKGVFAAQTYTAQFEHVRREAAVRVDAIELCVQDVVALQKLRTEQLNKADGYRIR